MCQCDICGGANGNELLQNVLVLRSYNMLQYLGMSVMSANLPLNSLAKV